MGLRNIVAKCLTISFFERFLLHAVPWMDLKKRDFAASATKWRSITLHQFFVTMRRVGITTAKAMSIKYSECVSVASVIQHAKRMRRIILSLVAFLALPYFSKLSYKRQDFRRKKWLSVKCVLWFSLQCLSGASQSKQNSARCFHVKYLLFLSGFNQTWTFSADF